MFDRLGTMVSRHWALVLLSWAVLVAGIYLLAPRWDDVTHDGDFAYLPAEMMSVRGERLLEAAFPDVLSKSQVALVVARPGGALKRSDYRIADRLVEEFTPPEGDEGPITGVLSHRTKVVGEMLVSPDTDTDTGQALLILLQLRSEFMAIDNMDLLAGIYRKLDAVRGEEDFPKDGLELGVTGSAAIGYDMLSSAEESIDNTERATIILVIVILLVVYRAPGLVLVPLVTIVASVATAMGLVALATQWSEWLGWFDFKIFKTTKIFVVVILFGAGTDYCLFLISRYKEELRRGLNPGEAIARALGCVGDALAASALTTIVGLGAMVFSDFGKFRNSGPAIAMCLVVALVASMTLAPALLRASGRMVFWPFLPRRPAADDGNGRDSAGEQPGQFENGSSLFAGCWQWLSRQIIARPGLILVASLLLLFPLLCSGFRVDVNYDLLNELRADLPSVQGTDLLRRHFPAGQIGPVTMLAYNDQGGFDAPETRWDRIQPLSDALYGLEYRDENGVLLRPITNVGSLVEPLGEPPAEFGLFGGLRKSIVRGHPRTQSIYLAQAPEYAGKVTRFDLVFRYDPFSPQSIRLLDHVQDYVVGMAADPKSPWHGTRFYFAGTTAAIRDLKAVTSSDLVLIQTLVPLAVLAVLILILRRPLISIYLILSVLLGYFVTIGTTEWVFRWLYADTFQGLDWKVPIFLFVLLIALGQDYNIYLATRVFEEQRRHGPEEGIRVALVQTGGIITSCGVIMAGTFISMTTGTLRAMHELGFALALGVLLDTFVIRTILVPAFLVLWERYWVKSPPPDASEADGQLASQPEDELPRSHADLAQASSPSGTGVSNPSGKR